MSLLMPLLAVVSVYSHPLAVADHPDYARRHVKPPTRALFGNRPHFMALRELTEKGYRADLDRYVARDRLGDVIWANAIMLGNPNLAEQVAELKKRGYFLFDLWGYVPGFSLGTHFGEFTVADATRELLERELGDHWLGMDCGEQDGRYVSPFYGFSRQREPFDGDPVAQYLNFQRHFEYLHRMSGNRLAALVSLTYGHYLAKEGCYTLMGAETAQSLPNAQIYYSFLRGAGKQYGVPWFGNVSVYNHWGCKGYPSKRSDDRRKLDPERGTSLALMKKLMYAQILYGSQILGFECSHYLPGKNGAPPELSPIGRIQQGAADWCAKYGDPGIQHVPVALVFDFFSGWTYPRSHYGKKEVFQNWGAVPWNLGDFFADGVLNEIYPGYEASGFWRDERGFNADTPYGDCADCLLSDAPAWVLAQYPVVVLANRMRPSAEFVQTLRDYVQGGGQLVYTRGNREILFPEGFGATGKGRVTEIPSAWGVHERPQCALPVDSDYEKPFPSPHPLLPETKRMLSEVLRTQVAFTTSPQPAADGLSVVVCRRAKGEYTVGVLNNTWRPRPLALHSHVGEIVSKEELSTPDDVKGDVGYAPETFTNFTAGVDTPTEIAAGSVRLFRVKVREKDVRELPAVRPVANAANRVLALRDVAGPYKEELLRRPTFFRHWDAVSLDARYLLARSTDDIREQANWTKLQGLKVIVDLRPLLNHYPDARFADNTPRETARSAGIFTNVLTKAAILGAKDIVISPVRYDWYIPDYKKRMREGMERLADQAAALGMTVHVHVSWWRGRFQGLDGLAGVAALVKQINRANVKVAPSVADQLRFHKGDAAKVAAEIAAAEADLVFVSAPQEDAFGQLVSTVKPFETLSAKQREQLTPVLRAHKGRLVFDASYRTQDEAWRDAVGI